MPQGARYCAACKFHQGVWAQFWSQLKIQDLMGVMSVGALAITSIVGGTLNANALNPHSDIKASLLACHEDRVEFAISNIGNRSAFIGTGSAAANVRGQPVGGVLPLVLHEQVVLKPGETKPVTFDIKSPLPLLATADDRQQCWLGLAFTWVEPGAQNRTVTGICGCPAVAE
jgi:hypothetical protein